MDILKGYLTYIMAFVAVVYGLVGLVTGMVGQTEAMNAIWVGLAVFGVRRAMS